MGVDEQDGSRKQPGPGERSTVPRQRGRGDEAFAESDRGLVERMRRGDPRAYEELYRRHAEAVRRYARTCCRDADTADDLTNEVFAATLQAVRGGAGPRTAVRAYLLTAVRRVAADWARSARREHLVEDFAAFAVSANAQGGAAESLDPGADVRAMRAAERSMAVRAFRSLPERWQTVLWHTAVEESSPQEVAPLLGLTPNAAAVLAHRAREGLKQAYLQAHVNSALTEGGDCARFADRLGAFARGRLRVRAERGLRRHLEECTRCRSAASEVRDLNEHIRSVLPVAVVGWFAAGSSGPVAALLAGSAGGAAGSVAGAASGGSAAGTAAGSPAGASAGASGAVGTVTAGIATGIVASAVAAALVMALVNAEAPQETRAAPQEAEEQAPSEADSRQEPVPVPSGGPSPEPAPAPSPEAAAASVPPVVPRPAPTSPPGRAAEEAEEGESPGASPETWPVPRQASRPEPGPEPEGEPGPAAGPEPGPGPGPGEPEATPYPVRELRWGVFSPEGVPAVRAAESSWMWQRGRLSAGGQAYGHGVTVLSPSSVTIDLNRECVSFRALAGVDDLSQGVGAVSFAVHGDGEPLWTSGVLTAGEAAVPVSVPLAGVETLRLMVRPEGRMGAPAPADWAESVISCA